MRKIKYILLILIFCFCLNVNAIDKCTTDEMNRLRDLANKVEFKLSYEIEEFKKEDEDGNEYLDDVWANYKLQLINDNSDLKYYYRTNYNNKKQFITSSEISNLIFNDGSAVTFEIYSYTDNLCTNELLRIVKVDLPDYNAYYHYNKEKCDKYPDFKYCKEFLKVDKTDEEIDNLFDEYIKQKKTQNSETKVTDIISNNKYIFMGLFSLIIVVLIIIIIIKRNKKEQI